MNYSFLIDNVTNITNLTGIYNIVPKLCYNVEPVYTNYIVMNLIGICFLMLFHSKKIKINDDIKESAFKWTISILLMINIMILLSQFFLPYFIYLI